MGRSTIPKGCDKTKITKTIDDHYAALEEMDHEIIQGSVNNPEALPNYLSIDKVKNIINIKPGFTIKDDVITQNGKVIATIENLKDGVIFHDQINPGNDSLLRLVTKDGTPIIGFDRFNIETSETPNSDELNRYFPTILEEAINKVGESSTTPDNNPSSIAATQESSIPALPNPSPHSGEDKNSIIALPQDDLSKTHND